MDEKAFVLIRFARCRRGAIGTVAAILVPVMIAFVVGVAIEVGMWYAIKLHDQSAADAGTLAGIREAIAGQGDSDIYEKAACTVWRNGFAHEVTPVAGACPSYAQLHAAGVTVNKPATICPSGTCALVEVILKQPVHTFAFFIPSVIIGNRAAGGIAKTACTVLALTQTGDDSIIIQGSADTTVDQLCSNSNSSTSVYIAGGSQAKLTAANISTVGNYGTNTSSDVTGVGSVDTYIQPPFPDPYAGKVSYASAVPSTAPVAYTSGDPPTIGPDGTLGNAYCPMDLAASTSFSPGVYIIEGEDTQGAAFAVSGSGTVISGSGVTFIFTSVPTGVTASCATKTGGGRVYIQGGTVNLTAPTGGIPTGCTTASLCIPSGLLFYQDPTVADTTCVTPQVWNSINCNHITAGSSSVLQGVSYTPATTMYFQGNSDSACFVIIALQITFNGNETTNISSSASACQNLGVQTPMVQNAVLTE